MIWIRMFGYHVLLPLLLRIVFEGIVLVSSVYAGIIVRFMRTDVGRIESVYPIFPKALIFAFVMLSIMTAFGLYQTDVRQEGSWSQPVRFLGSFVAGAVAMLLIFYVFPGLFLGRGAFSLIFLFSFTSCAVLRFGFMRLFKLDMLARRTLLVGDQANSARIKSLELDEEGTRKFRLVGCLSFVGQGAGLNAGDVLDESGSVLDVARKYGVHEVVVGMGERRNGGLPSDQLLECKLAGIEVIDMPSFFERESGKILLEFLNPSWMVFSDGFRYGNFRKITKRMFDVVVSGLILLVTLPVMLVASLLIWLESGSPVLYRQERVGEYGRSFDVIKFRSMRKDAERDGTPKWAGKNDDRVTRVGRVIRKLRIDELPQIFNVLKGDMSFVGPRPERPYFVRDLATKIPYYQLRHSVKPGITGWAQVRYPYGATVEDAVQKTQYDLYYVKNHTLFLDLIILFQTVQVVLFGKGAR